MSERSRRNKICAIAKRVTGTIVDLLDENGVLWGDYFQDAPQGASFRQF